MDCEEAMTASAGWQWASLMLSEWQQEGDSLSRLTVGIINAYDLPGNLWKDV
jgi:hypothetical protein